MRRGPGHGGRAAALLALSVLVAGCGGGRTHPPPTPNSPGHARLRFSGAVTGAFDADLQIGCFTPTKKGDRFVVSMDSAKGARVGPNRTFVSMDVVTPDYDGAKTYDMRKAARAGEHFTADEFFLLFQEELRSPYGWTASSSGTITVDRSQTSGRLALRGWRNASGQTVDVSGDFRCGTQQGGG